MRHLRLKTHLVVLFLLDYFVDLLVQIVLIPTNLMLISLLNPTYILNSSVKSLQID